MKHILIIAMYLFFLAGLNPASAKKDPCKRVKELKDPFTNEVTRNATVSISGASSLWNFKLEKKGEKYFVTVDITTFSINRATISEGEKITIKLQNDKVIELELDKECVPTFRMGTQTNWSVNSEVDIKTMKRFGRSLIAAAKVNVQGEEVRLITNPNAPRSMEAIMDVAACITGLLEEEGR